MAPRLHVAYDLSGDGKTVIKGGWGRYDHMRQLEPDVLTVARNSIANAIYKWRDLNGNNDYDPGEVNLDPTRARFRRNRRQRVRTTRHRTPWRTPTRSNRRPMSSRCRSSGSWSRILPSGSPGSTRATTNILRVQNNLRPYEAYNIPVTNRDPGADGSVGTGDDGGLVTYYEYSPELAGAQFEQFMPVNDPNVDADATRASNWRASNGSRTGGSSWPPTRPRRKTAPSMPALAVGDFGSFDRPTWSGTSSPTTKSTAPIGHGTGTARCWGPTTSRPT